MSSTTSQQEDYTTCLLLAVKRRDGSFRSAAAIEVAVINARVVPLNPQLLLVIHSPEKPVLNGLSRRINSDDIKYTFQL